MNYNLKKMNKWLKKIYYELTKTKQWLQHNIVNIP